MTTTPGWREQGNVVAWRIRVHFCNLPRECYVVRMADQKPDWTIDLPFLSLTFSIDSAHRYHWVTPSPRLDSVSFPVDLHIQVKAEPFWEPPVIGPSQHQLIDGDRRWCFQVGKGEMAQPIFTSF